MYLSVAGQCVAKHLFYSFQKSVSVKDDHYSRFQCEGHHDHYSSLMQQEEREEWSLEQEEELQWKGYLQVSNFVAFCKNVAKLVLVRPWMEILVFGSMRYRLLFIF